MHIICLPRIHARIHAFLHVTRPLVQRAIWFPRESLQRIRRSTVHVRSGDSAQCQLAMQIPYFDQIRRIRTGTGLHAGI